MGEYYSTAADSDADTFADTVTFTYFVSLFLSLFFCSFTGRDVRLSAFNANAVRIAVII